MQIVPKLAPISPRRRSLPGSSGIGVPQGFSGIGENRQMDGVQMGIGAMTTRRDAARMVMSLLLMTASRWRRPAGVQTTH